MKIYIESYEYLSNHDLEKKNLLFSSRFINNIIINDKKILIKKLFLGFYFYFVDNNSINYLSKFNISKSIYHKKYIYILQNKLIQLFFFQKYLMKMIFQFL